MSCINNPDSKFLTCHKYWGDVSSNKGEHILYTMGLKEKTSFYDRSSDTLHFYKDLNKMNKIRKDYNHTNVIKLDRTKLHLQCTSTSPVVQMVEHLICKQQVKGLKSSKSTQYAVCCMISIVEFI